MEVSRRKFLGSSATAVIVAGMTATGKVFGANDRIGMATVGIHGQGGSHLKMIMEKPEQADIVALCDVDSEVLKQRAKAVEEKSKKKPKGYRDIRDLLEDKNVDAISIATPNHWHALAAIWACQAGKDVYVEKPQTHGVWEGRQLVAAAEKYGRIVQHGTQQRSNAEMMRDIKLIQDGFIGNIVHARGYVYKNGNRGSIGHGKPGTPPKNLDYNLWQGPAQEKEFLVKDDGSGLFVHYNWHWFWEFGNGEIGNQGVHEMDVAVWGMNKGMPVKVYSSGGRFGLDDDGITPNTQTTTFTYADGTLLTFEVRNLGSFMEGGPAAGNCSNSFFGTKGYYIRGMGFFDYDESKKDKPLPIPENAQKPETAGSFGNFFQAVRSRKQEDVKAPVTAGHVSCVHCHTGNIAFRLGRSLKFDPASQQFVGDEEANSMLKRQYREPFVVPELA